MEPTSPPPAPSPAPPRRRRWKKILLIAGGSVVGLLLLAAILVPTIVSSVAKSKIPEVLGPMLDADVTVGDVSFGWSGRLSIEDLKIHPKGFPSPLAEVKKVDAKISLGSAIGGRYIADVEVVAPKIVVEKNAQGRFNYDFPPQPKAATSEGPGGRPGDHDSTEEKLFVQAVLKVREGEVTVKGPGRDTVFRGLTVDAKVDTLAKPVEYALSLRDPQEGAVRVEGAFDLDRKAGPAKIALERLALANLAGAARAYGPDPAMDLGGRLGGTLDYRLDGIPVFAGKTDLAVGGLSVRFRGQAYELESLRMTHTGGLDARGNGANTLALDLGPMLGVDVQVDLTDALGARGTATNLRVRTDLAAVDGFLKKTGLVKADLKLAGTVALTGRIESKGPTDTLAATWDLETRGQGISVTLDGKPVAVGTVNHTHKGAIDEKGNATSTLVLSSGKVVQAEIVSTATDVFGTPAIRSKIDAKSDLGELAKLLEKPINLQEGMKLEGQAWVKGTVESKGTDSAKVALDAGATDLVAIGKDKKRYDLDPSIGLTLAAAWDGKTSTATAETVTLDSSFAKADAKGGASFGKELKVADSTLTLDADLGKLAEKLGSFLEKPPALGGRVRITAKGDAEKMTVDGTFTAVKFEAYGPLDATLRHDGTLDAKGNGKHTLRIDSGKALALSVAADLKDVLADGRAVAADVTLDSDLGALSAALPGLVRLKPGTGLAGTAAVTGRVATKGSTFASFDVDAKLSNLEAVEQATKKRSDVDKAVALRAKGAWDGAKKSVELETFTLTSASANAEARGGFSLAEPMSVRESSFSADANLKELGARLSLFMADPPGLAGGVTASGRYAGEAFDVKAEAKGVTVTTKKVVNEGGKDATKPSVIGPIDASLVQKGTFSTAKNGGLKIETCTLRSSGADAEISGEVRKVLEAGRTGELKLEATARPVEFSKWMVDLGLGGPPIRLSTTVSLKPTLIAVSGKTELKGLTIKDSGAGATKVARTRPLEFTVDMNTSDPKLTTIGARLKTASFEWVDQGYAAKGGLDVDVRVVERPLEKGVERTTTGTARVTALEIVDDKKNKVVEPEVKVAHDLVLGEDSYQLRKVEVVSGFLSGNLAGRVRGLKASPEFVGVKGEFTYLPDKMGTALKPWLPGTLAGAEPRKLSFTLDGKAEDMNPLAILRGSTGAVEVDLAKFTTTGTTVSGKTRLDLAQGKAVSGTPLQVNNGQTNLKAEVDLRKKELKPLSKAAFQAKDVDANANMGPLLENINPIFHTVNGTVDGKITADFALTWNGPVDPNEKEPDWSKKDYVKASRESLSGRGVFAVKNLNVVGSPTVKDIMAALGEGNAIQGELLGTDITIAGGRCEYTKMVLRMSRYQLVFSGWVDFGERDRHGHVRKRMEMMVEMPMTDPLRKKYPQLARYTGNSFFVPLKGTVDSPRLDFEAAIQELIKRALPALIEDKAKDFLEDLLKKKEKKK